MDPDIDPAHEERGHHIVRAAEQLVGEDRFGGAWIDRTSTSRPVLGFAVVSPTQSDVDAIAAAARDGGWPVQVVTVRYARIHLLAMLEAFQRSPLPGDAFVGLGWDARE